MTLFKYIVDKLFSTRRLWGAATALVFVRLAWVGGIKEESVMLLLGMVAAFLYKRDAPGNGNGGQQ